MEEYKSCDKCLQYLNKIEHQVRFRDAVLPTDAAADGWKSAELLKHYNRAIELLPEEWNDENYIIISVRHALLLLSVDEMNATFCINLIRINCNKAQVALSMAEYYLKKNDRESSLTCLERAHHRGAQPTSLIEEALVALKKNTPTLSHLIDSRFYYEPPDEVPLTAKVDANGESRASTSSKHRPEKPRIKSGDHSVAKKLLVDKDPFLFPSEQSIIYKPMRVPRKQKDDEPPEPSEQPDLQPSTSGERCGTTRLAEEARQLSEGGVAAAARPPVAVDRVPAWPPKAPPQNRKAGPQLKFRSPPTVDPSSSNFGDVYPLRKNVCINGQLYNISKVIGRGGSCVVYEAMKSQNGDDVYAIKLVSFVAVDEAVIASYKNEVKMLLRLQKTGKIIRLFDHEIQEEGMALLMERAEADFKWLLLAKSGASADRKALLPARECLRLWQEMLECVEALHENGVVHLDLKPGNFVLVKGVPKLIDLGISHSIPEDRTSVTLQHQMGTIDYMSPEQLPDSLKDDEDDVENVKKRIGRKSDVWALGCILYLLMFGQPPFRKMHLLRRLQSINSDKPVTVPDYPEAPQLVRALHMCFQRDPNARASVADILAFLKENPA